MEQLQHLLAGLQGTAAVGQPLEVLAGEGHAAQGVRREVFRCVFEGGDVIDAFEEAGHVDAEEAWEGGRVSMGKEA